MLSLRNRYLLMCKSQTQIRNVLADPNLNLDLLELEESLLELKLINIEEVKNVELLADPEHNTAQVTKIIEMNLSEGSFGNLRFVEALLKESKLPPARPKSFSDEQEITDMLTCIRKLAEYARLPSREVSGHGLIENKWAKSIIANETNSNNPNSEHLNADRIFRNRYAVLLQHIYKLVPQLHQKLIGQNPKLKVFWSHTLIKLGLHEEAMKVLPRLTVEMLPESPRELYELVDTLNNLNNRVDVLTASDELLTRLTKLAENGALYRSNTKRNDLYS